MPILWAILCQLDSLAAFSASGTDKWAIRRDFLGWKLGFYLSFRHDDGNTFCILAFCEGNPPVTGGFPSEWFSNAEFDSFFVVSLDKLLIKWLLKRDTLTHWGRVTHICISKLPAIGSDNILLPGQRQAIIWTNAWTLLIGPLWPKLQWNFNCNSNIFIQENAFESVVCEMAAMWSWP